MNKSLFLISCLILFSLASNAQDAKAGAILDAMSAKYKKMESFQADFTYGAISASGKQGRVRPGSITVKGIKFKLNMAGQEIFNNGSEIYAFVKETNEVNVTEFDASEDSQFSPANIYNIYKNGYDYTYVESKSIDGVAHEVIELIPLGGNGNVQKLEITVENKSKVIKNWKLWDGSGKQTIFDILKFNPNIALADGYFDFNLAKYPGVEVVDLR